MMALMLKDSPELRVAKRETARAVDANSEALSSLLECIYGIGETGKDRISLLVEKVGEDGKGNTRRI
jgi:hypothetical protein